MFAKATAKFVRQIDPDGTLISVSRLNDSDKLVPMALVVKRNRFWFWQRPKYLPSDFTLSHLLLGDKELTPDVSESDFLSYEGRFGDNLSGKLDAKAGSISVNVEGRCSSKFQLSFGKLKKQDVDVQKLLLASNDRVVDMQHVLVQQSQKHAEVFAVLKERILTTTPCSISEQVQEQGTCQGVLGLLGKLGTHSVKVCVQENSSIEMDSDVSLEIPPLTVIAYSLIELEVRKDGHYELCLQHGTLGGFEADSEKTSPSQDSFDTLCVVDGLEWAEEIPEGAPLSALQKNLQDLEVYLHQLVVLPESTRSTLFQRLCEVLVDRTSLTVLEHTLEGLCRGEDLDPTEVKELSVSQIKSVSALSDLVQKFPPNEIQAEGTSIPLHLTATHLLVSALEALPDAALTLLGESSPDVLEALNTLLKVNGQSLPFESLPLPLQEEGAFHWAEQLLLSSNVMLRRETDRLWAETGKKPGVFPLVMCIAVQGLTSLYTGKG
ncbi:gasdermin-E isoform X1 [Oncorhynchus tshawytscha]|uniref:Non-syndromic hearing impairment protein 5 n=1 Tax=Oncorhynchus tshawytscha TaxID=74940 RepID=A0AAZ3PKN5_ONCTS|nr:gasdermin-E isoform X1 [Oncorhynchus tshawytscha]